MMLPVAGAVLGGAVGGPVGIVAGLKAAKLAAFGGGILGMLYTSNNADRSLNAYLCRRRKIPSS